MKKLEGKHPNRRENNVKNYPVEIRWKNMAFIIWLRIKRNIRPL
jgi:hypothetical protein